MELQGINIYNLSSFKICFWIILYKEFVFAIIFSEESMWMTLYESNIQESTQTLSGSSVRLNTQLLKEGRLVLETEKERIFYRRNSFNHRGC